MSVDVVLPCLDEVEAIPFVLSRLPSGWRAIVVDNGSTDGSAEYAREHGALVVSATVKGYGSACHAGLQAATAQYVCFCDCDASIDPADLPTVAAPVLAGQAEMAIGRRRPETMKAWPPHARVANVVLARRLRKAPGLQSLRDLGPVRFAEREGLLGLGIEDRRSGYPVETALRAARAGWRITQVDVTYRPRSGRSKVTGTARGTWNAWRDSEKWLAEWS